MKKEDLDRAVSAFRVVGKRLKSTGRRLKSLFLAPQIPHDCSGMPRSGLTSPCR